MRMKSSMRLKDGGGLGGGDGILWILEDRRLRPRPKAGRSRVRKSRWGERGKGDSRLGQTGRERRERRCLSCSVFWMVVCGDLAQRSLKRESLTSCGPSGAERKKGWVGGRKTRRGTLYHSSLTSSLTSRRFQTERPSIFLLAQSIPNPVSPPAARLSVRTFSGDGCWLHWKRKSEIHTRPGQREGQGVNEYLSKSTERDHKRDNIFRDDVDSRKHASRTRLSKKQTNKQVLNSARQDRLRGRRPELHSHISNSLRVLVIN